MSGPTPIEQALDKWHRHLRGQLPGGLDEVLADDVTFWSPIVHRPQRGKALTTMYLQAAMATLPGDGQPPVGSGADRPESPSAFRYVREVVSGDSAVLEFETTVSGIFVNGVDMIRADDHGRIVDFKVMLRPLKAINLVHDQMRAMLAQMSPPTDA